MGFSQASPFEDYALSQSKRRSPKTSLPDVKIRVLNRLISATSAQKAKAIKGVITRTVMSSFT